ncbi:MAG: PorP/SprF family type IX secretion system membrane protein [Bacteroides sp.]|nr:PorP/SprF family type IX secretion system membrane protein [Bacteroides sp.]
MRTHFSVILSRILPSLVAALAFTMTANAQNEVLFSQYWALPTVYNPATTGDTDYLRIRGGARLQWVGVTRAPSSFAGAGDIPFKLLGKRIGAGVVIQQESIGLFSKLLTGAQGSYKFKFLKGQLGIGIQLAYFNTKFHGSDVYIPDNDDFHEGNDPAIPTQDLSGNAFDASVGLSYTHRLFYAGISAMHITSPKVNMTLEGSESTESQQYQSELPMTIYFNGGSNIEIKNTLFELQPSLLVATDLNSFAADITVRAKYNKFISFGLGYRWNDALSIMVGAEYKNFFLGYAFDYPLSPLARASSGSHELVAGYQLKLDLSGKNKNKHRSIRIM